MKTNTYGLLLSILLFLSFIVLAIKFESTAYLYIASIFPLVIVPFLPDIRSSQYIRTDKPGQHVRLIKLRRSEETPSDLLVIAFEPGFILWQKNMLYFKIEDAVTHAALLPEDYIVTMPVLKFDLKPHPRKKNWVGISLPQIIQRTQHLSFTTAEINRLVIFMKDLKEVLNLPDKRIPSADRSLQA
jgi:hypothetical protein